MTETQRIVETLKRHRLPISNEDALQRAVADLLTSLGIDHKREKRFNIKDRVDFFTSSGLAIELKIDGSDNGVLRQLLRYAECGSVRALLLITTRSKHLNLPPAVLGKPLTVYQVVSL